MGRQVVVRSHTIPFAVVAVAVGLSNTSSYQLAVLLFVLFAAFAAQVKHNPYISHAYRELVVAEHDAKCATDPLHKAIEADIAAVRAKNTRKGVRSTNFFDPRKITKGGSAVDAAILAALDYNSVSMRDAMGGRLWLIPPFLVSYMVGRGRYARLSDPGVPLRAHVYVVALRWPAQGILQGGRVVGGSGQRLAGWSGWSGWSGEVWRLP